MEQMKRYLTIIGALILGTALASSAAAAGTGGEEALQMQIFGHALGADKAHACFNRVYDKSHLAQHPRQNVRSMTLLITGDTSDPNAPSYSVGLDVLFRKTGPHFQTYGSCGTLGPEGADAVSVGCGVDCDGGEIDVKLKDDNTVLVAIPDGARLWDPNSDSEDDTDTGRGQFGSDDKLFRLNRAGLTECLPLAADDNEKAAMKNGQ